MVLSVHTSFASCHFLSLAMSEPKSSSRILATIPNPKFLGTGPQPTVVREHHSSLLQDRAFLAVAPAEAVVVVGVGVAAAWIVNDVFVAHFVVVVER